MEQCVFGCGVEVRLEPSAEKGLSKVSAADTFQVRSISQQRLIHQLGILSEKQMQAISQALVTVLSIYKD